MVKFVIFVSHLVSSPIYRKTSSRNRKNGALSEPFSPIGILSVLGTFHVGDEILSQMHMSCNQDSYIKPGP